MDQLDSFGKWRSFYSIYIKILKSIIFVFLGLSTLGIVIMMVVTCVDIICRILRISFTGAYDIVMIAGAITITCALPYTTAVKGHVAIGHPVIAVVLVDLESAVDKIRIRVCYVDAEVVDPCPGFHCRINLLA